VLFSKVGAIMWILLAVMSGFVNIINKLINVKIKSIYGIVKGSILNYFEGAVISLLISILLTKSINNLDVVNEIPKGYLTGGFFGIIPMVMFMIGMPGKSILFSTTIILAGQLVCGLIVDFLLEGNLSVFKIIGIIFIMIGVSIDRDK